MYFTELSAGTESLMLPLDDNARVFDSFAFIFLQKIPQSNVFDMFGKAFGSG
jgi:hypothetical protein